MRPWVSGTILNKPGGIPTKEKERFRTRNERTAQINSNSPFQEVSLCTVHVNQLTQVSM